MMFARLRLALRYPADWMPEMAVVAIGAVVAWEAVKALWRWVQPVAWVCG